MANELNIALSTGLTVTAQPYTAGAASGSAINLSEVSTSGFYTGNMTGASGTYQLVFLSGGATVGTGQINWSGTAELPLSTFNPATDTVARVTLTDTATTLTNSPDVPTEAEIATAVWGAATKEITGGVVDTLTNAPTVPSASAIADEVRVELATELARIDAPISGAGNAPSASTVATAVRTELATELARVDAAISTRLADADYVAPANSDVAAVKAVTDALVVERLNNTATTAIVGHLISQANS
jgi:hypothetical protein